MSQFIGKMCKNKSYFSVFSTAVHFWSNCFTQNELRDFLTCANAKDILHSSFVKPIFNEMCYYKSFGGICYAQRSLEGQTCIHPSGLEMCVAITYLTH